MIWHRPPNEKPRPRWHLYADDGMSLCAGWALIGTTRPKDARVRKPQNGRCGDCLKRSDWNKSMAQLRARRLRKKRSVDRGRSHGS